MNYGFQFADVFDFKRLHSSKISLSLSVLLKEINRRHLLQINIQAS